MFNFLKKNESEEVLISNQENLSTLHNQEEVNEEKEAESVLNEFLEAIENNKSHDVNKILSIVLAKARRITAAEAGSIFITRPVGDRPLDLLSCVAQNDAIELQHEPFTIPINSRSIAGYIAQESEILNIDDLYDLSPEVPYTFNRSFDDKHDYRSVSMLAFPLKNFNKEVIGIVQLINHISGVDENGETEYSPFPQKNVEQMKSVMTILGVMVERIDLLSEISKLRGTP